MFQPKILKPKKSHKGKNYKKINPVVSLSYGVIKLVSIETGILSSKHFKVIKYTIKKGIFYIIKFPQRPVSKKPLEVRMGKGKGAINFWSCQIGLGCLICKLEINNKILGIKSLLSLQSKLPILTKIISS